MQQKHSYRSNWDLESRVVWPLSNARDAIRSGQLCLTDLDGGLSLYRDPICEITSQPLSSSLYDAARCASVPRLQPRRKCRPLPELSNGLKLIGRRGRTYVLRDSVIERNGKQPHVWSAHVEGDETVNCVVKQPGDSDVAGWPSFYKDLGMQLFQGLDYLRRLVDVVPPRRQRIMSSR